MHILLVADGRSPITRNWLRMLGGLGHQISLVSTFPYEKITPIERQFTIPVAFSTLSGSQVAAMEQRMDWVRRGVAGLRPLLLKLRALAAPLMLGKPRAQFRQIVAELRPDAIHALRIPFEGMLAAAAPREIPLILSIWGNDLTLHARTSAFMARETNKALQRADGLLADAARDLRLAGEWDCAGSNPSLVLPGNGGLDLEEINRTLSLRIDLPYKLPEGRTLIVNPRGFRPGSVHQDVFFRCLPQVVSEFPDLLAVCTGMAGQAQAERWVAQYGLQENVQLLPYLNQAQLWQLFSRSLVYVSLSSHDGTPNTLLEALACGCFPVAGNIESLREWIRDGENGYLVDPRDAGQAAQTITHALKQRALRHKARQANIEMLKKRAEISVVRAETDLFYARFLSGKPQE